MSDVRVSIVIPCYRSGEWLADLVREIVATLSERGEPFEVILVNDASPDATWETIERIVAEEPRVRGVDLSTNYGQFRAIVCGLERARGELIVTMDDDFQTPPSELPALLDALEGSPELDCVIAAYDETYESGLRKLGSAVMQWLNTNLYGKPPGLRQSSFRVLRRQLALAICQHRTVNPILGPIIYRTTRRLANVTLRHAPREHGKSGYSLRRLIRIVLDNVLGASTWPLRLVCILGLVSASLSALLGLVYLIAWLRSSIQVPGFATQVLLIVFFGGSILFSVGLLGEYMIRILDEVRGRPRYVVRRELGGPGDA